MPDLFTPTTTDELTITKTDTGFLDVALKAKELLPQIDWVITQRKSDYLPDLLELQKHKSIQVRRKVASGIASISTSQNIPQLQQWQVHEGDRQTWLILEAAVDKLERGVAGDGLDRDVRILSVSEALKQIKHVIGEKVYRIEGELAEVRNVRQMYYFGVKDKEDVRLDCAAFVGKIIKAGFPMNEGLQVRLTGTFKLSKYSKLYFDVDSIELTGEGELRKNFELLKAKLEKEGFFDESRKRKPRLIPKNILLLASSVSAALTDFTKVLEARIGGVTIYHLPIKTQGVSAEIDILESLRITNQLIDKHHIDTIVITRGGGSQDDLAVFNSEAIVRELHSIKRPIIAAIGHERDVSLVELAADVRASTPSNAAELVSLSRDDISNQTESISNSLRTYFFQRKQRYLQTSLQLTEIIRQQIRFKIENSKKITNQTDNLIQRLIFQARQQTQNSFESLKKYIQNRIQKSKESLNWLPYQAQNINYSIKQIRAETLYTVNQTQTLITNSLTTKQRTFQLLNSQIQLLDPKNILTKGYAIIYQEGKVVETKKIFKTSKKTKIQFQDGELELK